MHSRPQVAFRLAFARLGREPARTDSNEPGLNTGCENAHPRPTSGLGDDFASLCAAPIEPGLIQDRKLFLGSVSPAGTAAMWETDDFDEGYLRLICLIGVIIFFLLGAVALALHLSLVDTVLFFSMGIPFLVLLLYGLFVTHEVMG